MKRLWLPVVLSLVVALYAVIALDADEGGPVATLTSPDEPGTPLVISGRAFHPDGSRGAAGVTIHAHQTNARGEYNRSPTGVPRLRGSATTAADGTFELRTIRPASYPGRQDPAHIHLEAWGGGYRRQWLDSIEFADDPFHTPETLREAATKGRFNPIVVARRGEDGVLRANINVRLSTRPID